MYQCTLGGVGGHRVDPAQQQRMMGQQQAAVGNVLEDRGGGIDGDGHRGDGVVRIPTDQADGVPGLRQCGRISGVEHPDDVRQPHCHVMNSSARGAGVRGSGTLDG